MESFEVLLYFSGYPVNQDLSAAKSNNIVNFPEWVGFIFFCHGGRNSHPP
jgi:hypothetical protein